MLQVATHFLLQVPPHRRPSRQQRAFRKGRATAAQHIFDRTRVISYLAAKIAPWLRSHPPQIAPAPGNWRAKINFVAVGMPALGIPHDAERVPGRATSGKCVVTPAGHCSSNPLVKHFLRTSSAIAR